MPARPAALLMDLDGTLVDSEPRHYLAHREFLATVGIPVSERQHHAYIGKGDDVFYRDLMAAHGLSGDPVAWVRAKTDVLIGQYRRDGLRLGRGGETLVARIVERGFPRMVVTGSERRLATAALDAAGLAAIFPCRVVREDTREGKPHPAPYLLAAARLGIPPASCLAVEDSVVGVRSAAAAGCQVAGLFGLVAAQALREAGAAWLIDDLAEVVRIIDGAP